MYKLVDSQQMTFIKGGQIMDAVLIANVAIDSRVDQKKPGMKGLPLERQQRETQISSDLMGEGHTTKIPRWSWH